VAPGADRRRIADEHLPVLGALRRRDPALAVEVLHAHFSNAAAMLERLWGDAGPSSRNGATDDNQGRIERSA
jgi:DNA-binding GntR family transcriptional regulator